ncbi:expressed unknown protein [Seminavis robusta]|uniref:Peptidase M10 metallopeptidase domain-containing protein n=1 Tax=Seminavis robusta TaxID=568900 RepID=A0A9N8HR45_9STRA|nr:expressed unknown protein [Seminavis robusta]|eukprot:Sro1273_g258310.1 n/a (356) ;mRNA; f:13913-15067
MPRSYDAYEQSRESRVDYTKSPQEEYREAIESYNLRVKLCQTISGFLCNVINLFCIGLIATTAGLIIWNHIGQPKSRQELMDALGRYNVDDFINVLQNLTDTEWNTGFNEDPYVGDNTTQMWKGADGYTGLSLTLQNALDDAWQTEFEAAVDDWKESAALALSTERVDVDHTCARVTGVMVVCNGNFGETGWVGINEVELEFKGSGDPGVIVSSVAKMNEFYLNHADYYHRQYTMCHEIGHGFGLPHTDENPNNQDQGNCLDYTVTPRNNMHPGDVNMNRLLSMYMQDDYDDTDDYMANDDNGNDDGQGQNDDGQAATDQYYKNKYYNDDWGQQGGRYLRGGRRFRRIVRFYHYV